MYRFLPHTADVKIEAIGNSLAGCFRSAALALKEVIADNLDVKSIIKKKISIESENKESLLYDFLEEFLYLLDAEDFLLTDVGDIKIKDNKLEAVAMGDNAENYEFSNKVKAVTYNEMEIIEENGKFICRFVLDV